MHYLEDWLEGYLKKRKRGLMKLESEYHMKKYADNYYFDGFDAWIYFLQ